MAPVSTTSRVRGRAAATSITLDTAALPTVTEEEDVPFAPPAKPTWDELCDELKGYGHSDDQVQRLMGTFAKARDGIIDLDAGTSNYVRVSMSTHDLLDAVMKDKTPSTPGSTHERLEQHFLPQGWGLEHDKHGYCSVQAIPKAS